MKIKLASLLLFAFLLPEWLYAQGENQIMVHPTRIVMEDNTYDELRVTNHGPTTVLYRITVIDMEMDENGMLQTISDDEAPEWSLKPWLRIGPRQFRVGSGRTQRIRLAAPIPRDTPREYRSHLLIQAIDTNADSPSSDMRDDEGPIVLNLNMLYGVAVPVFARTPGLPVSAVKLRDINIERDANTATGKVRLFAEFEGKRSAFGNFSVYYRPDINSERILLGELNRIAIYHERGRNVEIPLQYVVRHPAEDSLIEVEYHTRMGNERVVLAKASLYLNSADE